MPKRRWYELIGGVLGDQVDVPDRPAGVGANGIDTGLHHVIARATLVRGEGDLVKELQFGLAQIGQLALFLRLEAAHLIEPRLHGRKKQTEVDRLGKIVVGADLHASEDIMPVGESGQEDERHVGEPGMLLAQLGEQFLAVHHRHADIAYHQAGLVLVDRFKALSAVRRLDRLVTRVRELSDDQFPNFGFVFDAQNLGHGRTTLSALTAR